MLIVEAKNSRLVVEGCIGSDGRQSSPPRSPKRSKRRDVTGAPGLQFNQAGIFYRNRHEVTLEGVHEHLIDPGKHYDGPVPPAYGGLWTGAYLRNPDDDREDVDAALVVDRRRRAADLIAYERFGPPPGGWSNSWAVHLDGNPRNAAPDNLCWSNAVALDVDWRRRDTKHLMVSDVVACQMFNRDSRGGQYRAHKSKESHPDVFAREQLDVPLRHRMVHYPPNKAREWRPDGDAPRRQTN